VNNTTSQEEALTYAKRVATMERGLWIIGILITVCILVTGIFTDKISISFVSLILPGVSWLLIAILVGIIQGKLIYRRCVKNPEVYAKQISAFNNAVQMRKKNGFFGITTIKAWMHYGKSRNASYNMSALVCLIIGLFTLIILYHLKQLHFVLVLLSGYYIGIDLFWNLLSKKGRGSQH